MQSYHCRSALSLSTVVDLFNGDFGLIRVIERRCKSSGCRRGRMAFRRRHGQNC